MDIRSEAPMPGEEVEPPPRDFLPPPSGMVLGLKISESIKPTEWKPPTPREFDPEELLEQEDHPPAIPDECPLEDMLRELEVPGIVESTEMDLDPIPDQEVNPQVFK